MWAYDIVACVGFLAAIDAVTCRVILFLGICAWGDACQVCLDVVLSGLHDDASQRDGVTFSKGKIPLPKDVIPLDGLIVFQTNGGGLQRVGTIVLQDDP